MNDWIADHGATAIVIAAITALLGVATLIWVAKSSYSHTKTTLLSAISSILFSVAVGISVMFLSTGPEPGFVTIDPVKMPVHADVGFDISGNVHGGGHELWVVVTRPSGGIDVASWSPVGAGADGKWRFSPVRVGRPGKEGSTSPDVGAEYTIQAVLLSNSGASKMRAEVAAQQSNGSVFLNVDYPSGIIAIGTTRVQVSR